MIQTYCCRPRLTITVQTLNAPSSLNRSGVHAHRATTSLTECHDTVTPGALGAVQRLVGGFEHFFGVRCSMRSATPMLTVTETLEALEPDGAGDLAGRPADGVLVAQLNVIGGDGLADDLQVRHALLEGLAGEHQGELLTAIAIRLAAPLIFDSLLATRRSTWSPTSWPWVSLNFLKWSTSLMAST
jgi:hypothetical protein